MPLPVIDNTYRVALRWRNTDTLTEAVNVMHFVKTGSDPLDIVTTWDDHADGDMWSCMGTHTELYELDVTPLDGTSTTFPWPTPLTTDYKGQRTTNQPLPQVACVVKLVTLVRGRSYRGRVFLPFVDESETNAGRIDTDAQSTMQAAWVAFHTALEADGMHLAIASYKLSVVTNVAAILVERDTATQRRRQHRVSNV